jgi:uncharacterized protein (DUF2235 family)
MGGFERETMKRIAVFCDGTWNRSDAPYPTNVVSLAQAVRLTASDGMPQQVFYVEGVGTGRGSTGIARWLDRKAGGAFGLGLTMNLEEAYRNLVFAYEPGDAIYLFGFSRGAFTARSLAGFIRSAAIPERNRVAQIPEALARYRSRQYSTHPDHPESLEFRRNYAPALVTSPVEAEWRFLNGHPEGLPLRIAYVGVWDTVGALGVPAHLAFTAWIFNGPHQFHDLSLSSSVAAARHAVAIDERRRTFEPTLWDNMRELNDRADKRDRPYRQEWFPGVHGSVGGGGDIVGLSDAAAVWVAEGASDAGLEFEPSALAALRESIDATAPLRNSSAPPGPLDRALSVTARDRDGPDDASNVSALAKERWRRDPSYRPPTLSKVAGALG